MIIIGLTGLAASGKDRAAEYMVKRYQASRYGFSQCLRTAMDALHIEKSRPNLAKFSLILRQNFGEDLLAKAMAEDIKMDNSEYIIIDGIRREADIFYLTKIKGFHLVSIDADIKVRYERLIMRRQNSDDNKTFEEFVIDHDRETETSIPPIMKMAEFKIDNNGTHEELEKKIDKIIEQLKINDNK